MKEMIVATMLTVLLIGPVALSAQEKEVFGWVERIGIRETGFSIQAKLDTGADSSSIHASKIEEFKKNGVKWVRFLVRNHLGESASIERPVERTALIKRHNGESQRRYVVRLGLCLGSFFQEEDVNLVNRSKFDYRFLVGRAFLVGNALVDPSIMFSRSPSCKQVTPNVESKKSKTDGVSKGAVRK